MSTFSDIRLTAGLSGIAAPSSGTLAGSLQVGQSATTKRLTTATKQISFEALLVGASSDLVIDVSDLDGTGTTAFTAGTAQKETATVIAAGGITGNGNATVIVTAAGMSGTPKTISVPVTTTAQTTATLIATAIKDALLADTAVAALFTPSSSGADVILTRKATANYTVKGTTIPIYPADDNTLNISIANGTCTGITTAATSTDTTAGVATAGVYAPELDGNDAFGDATGGMTAIHGLHIYNSSLSPGGITITQGSELADFPLGIDDVLVVSNPPAADITIEPVSTALVTVTLAGL